MLYGRYKNVAAAGTYTLVNVSRLGRIVVGTGASNATVTVRTPGTDDTIVLLDASAELHLDIDLRFSTPMNLEVVVAQTPNVTILYD